ncbi:MAG: peptidylprolyl isomerase [Planctomycetes bacterium]|nr:peptidylprolyl isomerase [Planctomycetota bacterium]
MMGVIRSLLATLVLVLLSLPAVAQDLPLAPPDPGSAPSLPPSSGTGGPPPSFSPAPPAAPAPVAAPAPAPNLNAVAATVNGQPILEVAVQRGLNHVPEARRGEVRPEIINFLIENTLIDQYLMRVPIPVDQKDVDAKIQQIRDAIAKQNDGSTLEKVLQELQLTETELRTQIAAQIRWDNYVNQQATPQVLQSLFENNREMFDGSMVRARHILLTPTANDDKARQEARDRLTAIKKQIEEEVARGLAQLPPNADDQARKQALEKLLPSAFGAMARKESACPSKAQDGDLGWFPRSGSMVEPFAKVAFALKPFQMSEIVATQFGYHLILVTDRRPGKETKFEDAKEEVKDVLSDRLREDLLARLKTTARIVVNK